jgi:hypothetical protein
MMLKSAPTPVGRAIQALLLCASLQPLCQAQPEFESFKITGAEGHVALIGQTSSVSTSSDGGGTSSHQQQTDLRLETSLMTHSYIYHPKLLSLDLGLGLVTASGHSDSDGFSSSNRDALYNISAHARVLADKPARGSLFYERLNNTPTVDPGEIFNQQNTRYGLAASLLAPLTPVGLDLSATREHNLGSSATRVVDDKIDRVNLRGERSLPNNSRTQFSYQVLQQSSSSGLSNLALQSSQQESKNLSIDTRLRLGTESPYEVNNRIEYSRQKYTQELGYTPELDDLRFTLDANATPGKQLRTFANYQFGRNRQDARSLLTDSANAWASWTAAKDFDVGAGVHLNDAKSPQFSNHSRGVDGNASYNRALPVGTGQVGYSVRYEQREQNAVDTQVAIVGERVRLNGTTAVALARPLVNAASVLVFNATRTQAYVPGIDYALSVIGNTTRVQRLLSGNILDGEEVLVDYVFDVGGTYASSQLDQSLNLNWAVSNMLSVYLRVSDSAPTLRSGTPTAPLNPTQTRLIGARADVPLSSRFELVAGGQLEREDHRELLSPYVRSLGGIYLQGEMPLETRNNYRLGAQRTRVTAENQLQDSDLISYDLTLGWRFNTGLNLNAIGLYERDSGGSELRVRKSATLKANWRYRRLNFSADLSRTREQQGIYVRDRTLGRVDLRRDF